MATEFCHTSRKLHEAGRTDRRTDRQDP